jgi:hypothetical protein
MNTDDAPTPPPIEAVPEEKPEEFREGDVAAIEYFKEAHSLLRHQIGKVIVGQDLVIEELLIAIFTTHCSSACRGSRKRCSSRRSRRR